MSQLVGKRKSQSSQSCCSKHKGTAEATESVFPRELLKALVDRSAKLRHIGERHDGHNEDADAEHRAHDIGDQQHRQTEWQSAELELEREVSRDMGEQP